MNAAAADTRDSEGQLTSLYRAMVAGAENADMTSREEGFEPYSEQWYGVAVRSAEELFEVYSEEAE